MASPQEKLADALEALGTLQNRGVVAVRSADLSRTHRERLLGHGYLQQVMKGWYVASHPNEARGESTTWYASFWGFCIDYLTERFGHDWSLSPEQSVFIHAGNRAVPTRLLVRSPKARNRMTPLAHDTSLFETRASLPPQDQIEVIDGLRLFSLPAALVASGPGLFTQNANDGRTVLAMVRDASDVLAVLLKGGHSTVAGRLAGGFRNIGRDKTAEQILATMKRAGYDVREADPFDRPAPFTLCGRERSPYAARMRLDWNTMRERVIVAFPNAPVTPKDDNAYLCSVDDVYVEDAYHSLSIEGYRASRELIERVRDGEWNPDANTPDREQRDAMAAKGYNEAFKLVRDSVARVLQGNDPGKVAEDDHGAWYRELFGPSVSAGILGAADLAGYRNDQVFIRRSRHTPPSREAVRDLMPTLFDVIREETDPAVRAVLGHFMFVYIHPYMDGNGRMGRFLMNVMFAAGGYPWTIVPVECRDAYMASLEAASIEKDIEPFTELLAGLVNDGLLDGVGR